MVVGDPSGQLTTAQLRQSPGRYQDSPFLPWGETVPGRYSTSRLVLKAVSLLLST